MHLFNKKGQQSMRVYLVFGLIVLLTIIAMFALYGRVDIEGTNIITQTMRSLTNWG